MFWNYMKIPALALTKQFPLQVTGTSRATSLALCRWTSCTCTQRTRACTRAARKTLTAPWKLAARCVAVGDSPS